jgi:hypothetical protein
LGGARLYGHHQYPLIREGKVQEDNARLTSKSRVTQTDYVMEKYLGDITIVKYMKQRGYARREENIMNKQEFLETLALGLNFLTALSIN